jgi:hypothetical protein
MERKLSPPVWSDRVAVGSVDRQLAAAMSPRSNCILATATRSAQHWQSSVTNTATAKYIASNHELLRLVGRCSLDRPFALW